MLKQICLALSLLVAAHAYDLSAQQTSLSHLTPQPPVRIQHIAPNVFLVDFGRVAFGNLTLQPPQSATQPITVRFGEALQNGRIDRNPPGSVRYAQVQVTPNDAPLRIAPPADKRNTTPPAVLTPAAWGVVTPFRWVEIEGWPGDLRPADIQRNAAFDSSWHQDASSFHSSDPMLDRIWQLSHDSIQATTFAGIFVDGDRERIAYEADAYLNQLGYYAGNADPRMPRATFDRLVEHPTWPTEWAPHMVFIAYADWLQTGDRQWLSTHYEVLKTKLLTERVDADGLVESSAAEIRRGDLVDWPQGERDGYVFTRINTVVNAFHLCALHKMAVLAAALGKGDEASQYRQQERTGLAAFQRVLFDPAQGLYRDGIGTDHASMHANLFPLAFGLVPPAARPHIAAWLAGRGMAVSVYAAQYLLEGLFENGQSEAALRLMTAEGDRSWRHMVDAGATITWEAWDQKYKPNQDWNHAWGAAPANLLPRFVLGVQPLTPGWKTAHIEPHPGTLTHAAGTLPTPLGEVRVSWQTGSTFQLQLTLPPTMTAHIVLPALPGTTEVRAGRKRLAAHREGTSWVLDQNVSGGVSIEER